MKGNRSMSSGKQTIDELHKRIQILTAAKIRLSKDLEGKKNGCQDCITYVKQWHSLIAGSVFRAFHRKLLSLVPENSTILQEASDSKSEVHKKLQEDGVTLDEIVTILKFLIRYRNKAAHPDWVPDTPFLQLGIESEILKLAKDIQSKLYNDILQAAD